MKRFIIFCLCLTAVGTAFAQKEEADSVKQLHEVEIVAENEIRKDGYQLLFLSKQEKNFGTNALDAISSMNKFTSSINSDKLLSADQSEVYVLINGIPSTARDLRSFSSNDIKSIRYYSVAPPEYMNLTSGPVIDVILKTQQDRLYTGYFNAENAVNTGYGTDQASLAYRDSLNMVKVDYFLDYRNYMSIDIESRYNYNALNMFSRYNQNKAYKGTYQNVSASYQRFQGGHLFNAKLSYLHNPNKNTIDGSRSLIQGTDTTDYSSTYFLESLDDKMSLDLFYNYNNQAGKSVSVNVVNTFDKSNSDSELSSWIDPSSPITESSLIKNKSYSFIASSIFYSKLWNGTAIVNARYEYKKLNQSYLTDVYKPYAHNGFACVAWGRTFNTLSIGPAVGLRVWNQANQTQSHTSLLPYARFSSDWFPQGAWKGFSLQLVLSMKDVAPNLSMLTDSRTYTDYYFYSKGNPDLKDFTQYNAQFTIQYFKPNSKNYIRLFTVSQYQKNPFVPVIEFDGDYPILTTSNINSTFITRFYLHGAWSPFSWLEISPYAEFYIYDYATPSQKINTTYFRCGGSLTFNYNNWSAILAANCPSKHYDGDICQISSPQFAAIAQYKYRNWAFAAMYNFSGHNNEKRFKSDKFSYSVVEDNKPMHYLVRLSVVYSFNIGRAREHARKNLYESSNDNGLNQYNTPQRPL